MNRLNNTLGIETLRSRPAPLGRLAGKFSAAARLPRQHLLSSAAAAQISAVATAPASERGTGRTHGGRVVLLRNYGRPGGGCRRAR